MANSQELGRKIATTSPGASPAEIRPWARDSTRLPYSAKVKRRLQEVSISAVLLAFWRQLWRTTSWTKRPVGSAYSWVRSIGGDGKGGLGKLKVTSHCLRSSEGRAAPPHTCEVQALSLRRNSCSSMRYLKALRPLMKTTGTSSV